MDIFEKARQLRARLESTGQDSAALELLLALYYNVLDLQPKRPSWPARDRLFLSDAQLSPAFLTVLCDRGYFSPAQLSAGAPLGEALPGAEGLCNDAAAAALSEALRLKEIGGEQRVYALLSDADCRRGSLWESALCAADQSLSRLCFILCRRSGGIENICSRFSAFGFATCSVDGRSVEAVSVALESLAGSKRPVFICCDI